MYKIIALIGEAGVGKDTILRKVIERNPKLHKIISCTTRPKRQNEREGVDYFYLTNTEFGIKVINGEMFEATCFNDWFYGTSVQSLNKNTINIGVFNPDGIDALMSNPEVELTVYRIIATDKNRFLRQLNREENPNVKEIIRRYSADNEDFCYLDFPYIALNNNTKNDLIKAVEIITKELY